MKIAVTSSGEVASADVDPRFGRARNFLVFQPGSGAPACVPNTVSHAAVQGAGIQAARTVIDLGATVLLTGRVGPKAFAALQSAGVAVYPVNGGSVAAALERFRKGELKLLTGADHESPR